MYQNLINLFQILVLLLITFDYCLTCTFWLQQNALNDSNLVIIHYKNWFRFFLFLVFYHTEVWQ